MKITLCGSTKFADKFREWDRRLCLSGHIVYSIFERQDDPSPTEDEKLILDMVHFQKILNSDAILVLDVDGYIGFSTAREIQWAEMCDKSIYYMSNEADCDTLLEWVFSGHNQIGL